MPTTTTDDPARTFAERILGELQGMRQDLNSLTTQVSILADCAGLLLRPMDEKDKDSPLQAMMRLLDLLVGGTQETHKRLEAMGSMLFDHRMDSALRVAIDS